MARKKVKLQWIANDSTRRATFKKRKKGLLKKAHELSTLCDVKTCVVVYGGPHEREAEAWPSAAESLSVLRRFRSMPDTEQSKKMMDQEGFLRQRLAKAQEQLRRLERDNHELDTCLLMHDAIAGNLALNAAPIEEATALAWLVEMRLRNVQERIHHLRSSASSRSHTKALQITGPSTPAPSPTQSLTQGFILPPALPPPQMPPEAAANTPVVQAESSGMPAWYFNHPSDHSISFGRTEEMVSMQPYLDASSAWNNYLHHN